MTITLRPAQASDQKEISAIVRAAHINPMDVRWARFTLAMDGDRIVGVGQMKRYKEGSLELASIAVIPEYQHRGIASMVIEALLARENEPVYLFCRPALRGFYQRFGFEECPLQDLPPDVRRIHSLGEWMVVIIAHVLSKQGIISMRRNPPV